jgi:hypothetical protein
MSEFCGCLSSGTSRTSKTFRPCLTGWDKWDRWAYKNTPAHLVCPTLSQPTPCESEMSHLGSFFLGVAVTSPVGEHGTMKNLDPSKDTVYIPIETIRSHLRRAWWSRFWVSLAAILGVAGIVAAIGAMLYLSLVWFGRTR